VVGAHPCRYQTLVGVAQDGFHDGDFVCHGGWLLFRIRPRGTADRATCRRALGGGAPASLQGAGTAPARAAAAESPWACGCCTASLTGGQGFDAAPCSHWAQRNPDTWCESTAQGKVCQVLRRPTTTGAGAVVQVVQGAPPAFCARCPWFAAPGASKIDA